MRFFDQLMSRVPHRIVTLAVLMTLPLGPIAAQTVEDAGSNVSSDLIDPLFDETPTVTEPPAAEPVEPMPEAVAPPEPGPSDDADAPAAAEQVDEAEVDAAAAAAKKAAELIESNREILREYFTKGVTSRRTLESINRRVDRMTVREISSKMLKLAKRLESEQRRIEAAEQADQQRREAEQRRIEQQLLGPVPNVVQAPLAPRIWETPPTTVYDLGTPIGYAIGPAFPLDARIYVDPYGQVRRAHGSACGCYSCRRRRPRRPATRPAPPRKSGQREVWFDGLRTRYETRD